MKLILIPLIALSLPLCAQELNVAAAADLHPVIEELASHFQAQSGIRLQTIYGSSGDLFHQIENSAPFDVFLSANVEYPRKLAAAHQVVPGTYYEYAQGKIAVIVGVNSKLDISGGLSVLLNPAIRRIAIADPAHAPYGEAAIEALKSGKIYDQVAAKIVTGENVSQTASFVLSGAADAGIVALSLASSPSARSQIRYVEIPQGDYSPILQACVVLSSSRNQAAAAKFEAYLRGEEAAGILRRFGFDLPTAH